MPRLWPLLIAVPALALWLVELSITASSLSAQAEKQSAAYASRAVDAVAVRVAGRRAELQALTLRLAASPATWSTLEALRTGRGETATERMAAVRRVAQDAVSTGLRSTLVLGLRTDGGGSYLRGTADATPSLQGVEVDVLAGAGSDGQTRDAFGTYYLFFSVPLTGSDKDARALGTLMVGGPLLPDGSADTVSVELGLAAVGFITGGKLAAVGGPDRALLPAALRETPVGKSAVAERGSAGSLGPLKLPLWTNGSDPALKVAVRRSLPGQPVEVLAVADVAPFMVELADAQRFALSSMLVLALLLGGATVWASRARPAVARPDEDTVPPPRRTTPAPRPSLVRTAEPEPLHVVPDPPAAPPPLPAPAPSAFEAPPAALSAAVLDELDAAPSPSGLPPSRLPPPSPGEDLSALLDAMPPPPPPRAAPTTPSAHRTPSAPIGGRFTPAPRSAPPPPPLDYDHQPTTAYPIPDLPDFNAPPAAFGSFGPVANAIPDTTRVADIPPELLQAAARPMTTPVPRARPAVDEEHFQEVYTDFVAQRERCGESADGLTYERFATKLRKNRDQLMSKYGCRTVRFQVYVKDGKAALKATPVKD